MKRRRAALLLVGVLLPLMGIPVKSSAQWQIEQSASSSFRHQLTGNLRYDLGQLQPGANWRDSLSLTRTGISINEKSPFVAGALSLAIPGAGEFYSESYWKSVGFFAIEVGLWVTYAIYDNKGDRQTDLFQQFADDNWSVVRYVNWIEQYIGQLNPDAAGCSGIIVNGNPNLPPWERIDWNKLNACEEQIGRKTGNGFTHRLPMRPDQQYYELIGKYPQYAGGWNDGSILTPSDIVRSNVSRNFLDYSLMRGKANDFYNIASTAASVVVANHLLSALDAALSAAFFNKNLKMAAHLQPMQRPYGFVEFVPTATATIWF